MSYSVLNGIDGYDVEPMAFFFEKMTPRQRKFAEQVIRLACMYFPEADHYFSGGVDRKYIDLRIGVRARDKLRGRPYFWLWISNGDLRFGAHETHIPDSCLGKLGRWLGASEVVDLADLEGWFDSLAAGMKQKHIHIAGSGLRPADYGVTDVEPGEEMPGLVSAGKTADYDENDVSLNQILYGPPGTGKTYETIVAALEILDPEYLVDNRGHRAALKNRFDELSADGRIRFVTFHQSFSYEDFVEGLRAVNNDEQQLEYRVEPGVFKRLCDDARTHGGNQDSLIRSNPSIWKISINGTWGSPELDYCLAHGEARIGWGNTGDLREPLENNSYYQSLGSGDQGTLGYFANEVVPGDIFVCIHSAEQISAIGMVTGDYRYEDSPPPGIRHDYKHVRPVRWLYRDLQLSVLPLNDNRSFTQKTVYPLDRFSWGDLLAYVEKSGAQPIEQALAGDSARKPHVLIIDEINRGNVSRIFGELITLIEPSKREGADEALSTELPYSKRPFSVPDNIYLIGTMNTADRSLAGLDIALRRRFTFKEMPPKPELLDEVLVEDVSIGQLLRVMNQRIEVLLDREHCLGHAYFMDMESDESRRNLVQLALIFRQKILPLLQEYFFEDWERIGWVLNDQHAASNGTQPFIRQPAPEQSLVALFGSKVAEGLSDRRWELNDCAFDNIDSYRNILGNAG